MQPNVPICNCNSGMDLDSSRKAGRKPKEGTEPVTPPSEQSLGRAPTSISSSDQDNDCLKGMGNEVLLWGLILTFFFKKRNKKSVCPSIHP